MRSAELILSLDRLQTQGQEAVQQAAQAGRASRQLFEQSTTLERIVRQYLILEDSALLDDYGRVRQEFRGTAQQLALAAARAGTAGRARAASPTARAGCTSCSRRRSGRRTRKRSSPTATRSSSTARRRMLTATNDLTERAIERLQEIAAQGRREVAATWRSATAGIALALAILFAVLIARPIRQLDQAIRQMGTADFTHAIEVNGPQDLRYLGQRLEWLRSRLHGARGAAEPLPAPRLARAQDAAHRGARGRRAAARQRRRQALARAARDRAHRAREHAVAAEADRGSAHLPPDARDGAADAGSGAAAGRRPPRREGAQARRARAHGHVRSRRCVPALVVGDGDKIRTIVDNLVSNAIKYSPRSGADRRQRSRTDDGFAVLDVIDQGHGVDRRRARAHLRFVLPGQAAGGGPRQGLGARPRDRARVRARAWRAHRGAATAPIGSRGAQFRLWLPLAVGVRRSRRRRRRGDGAADHDRGRRDERRARAARASLVAVRRDAGRLRDAAAHAQPDGGRGPVDVTPRRSCR